MKEALLTVLYMILYSVCANSGLLVRKFPLLLIVLIPAALAVNLLAGQTGRDVPLRRLALCYHGTQCLIVFCAALAVSVPVQALLLWHEPTLDTLLFSVLPCVLIMALLFWNGMCSVFFTSVQLGVRTRVLAILWGLIPPLNLAMLIYMIVLCRREITFESEKELLNRARAHEHICDTRYPILLVHGVFFRDMPILKYWGRIPDYLERNGATVYYGEHQSADSVAACGQELADRIEWVCKKTGCEKVNVIAHSKGGLDILWACRNTAARAHVASITTVNTPFRGVAYADYLLEKVSPGMQKRIEKFYNRAARTIGDRSPDFMAAVRELTRAARESDPALPLDGIRCRSIGSFQKHWWSARLPLNVVHPFTSRFEGVCDGLVGKDSFAFGPLTMLEPAGPIGISHCDVIDLHRRNVRGFDVREFYAQLVKELKDEGL